MRVDLGHGGGGRKRLGVGKGGETEISDVVYERKKKAGKGKRLGN